MFTSLFVEKSYSPFYALLTLVCDNNSLFFFFFLPFFPRVAAVQSFKKKKKVHICTYFLC